MRLAGALIFVGLVVATGCGKKSGGRGGPSPDVSGLSAVPSSADVVVGVDVDRLVGSPIVERAVSQLLLRDPLLAEKWKDLQTLCKLDVRQINHLMLALGPPPTGGKPGTGPTLMVATGKLSEPELVSCVREVVGKGNGSLVVKTVDGKSLYQVKDGARTMYLAFGRADTVVLGTSETYVAEALGKGKKAPVHPELAAWLKRVDQSAPVWAIGRVGERVGSGLVRVTEGKLKAGPSAFVGSADLTRGAKLELGAIMASGDDAKQLESMAKSSLVKFAMAAQLKSLGSVVQKIAISSDDSRVWFKADLTMDDVNHVLSMLDGGGPPAQDSPPANGSGSSSPLPQADREN
ncbi:MAG: hypothetical protein ACTHU0_07045 [Kofleriaceae bacterium]